MDFSELLCYDIRNICLTINIHTDCEVYFVEYSKRLLKLIGGLILFGVGTVFTISTNLGFSPWQVFHKGLSNVTGLTLGQASISVGFIIIIINAIFKENMGLGTVLDMLMVGLVVDFVTTLGIIPIIDGLWGIVMIVIGLFIIAVGSYLYMSSRFGAGPRDGLMVTLTRLTKLPVGIIRGGIELAAVFFGWLMGGPVGIGTIISVLAIGSCIQLVFSIMKFDVTTLNQEFLGDTFKLLKKKIKA